MHIAVAGNIGCGKTTLTNMLAKHYGWEPRFESVDYNPYLSDFYEDMERWSFNLQIYFLNKRFKDVVEIGKSDKYIIQDRTIYEDARIFAPNLHEQGFMSDRDFDNYRDYDVAGQDAGPAYLCECFVADTRRADSETRTRIRAVDTYGLLAGTQR